MNWRKEAKRIAEERDLLSNAMEFMVVELDKAEAEIERLTKEIEAIRSEHEQE